MKVVVTYKQVITETIEIDDKYQALESEVIPCSVYPYLERCKIQNEMLEEAYQKISGNNADIFEILDFETDNCLFED